MGLQFFIKLLQGPVEPPVANPCHDQSERATTIITHFPEIRTHAGNVYAVDSSLGNIGSVHVEKAGNVTMFKRALIGVQIVSGAVKEKGQP